MTSPSLSQSHLPQRLSERAFRRFEPEIATIVASFPQVVEFKPAGSYYYFSSRLRDAMASLRKFNWSTIVDMEKFKSIDIQVSHRDGRIVAGSAEEILKFFKGEKPESGLSLAIVAQEEQTLDDLSLIEIAFLCRLASMRLINKPIRTSCMNFSDKEFLEESFDVEITDNKDGSFTII